MARKVQDLTLLRSDHGAIGAVAFAAATKVSHRRGAGRAGRCSRLHPSRIRYAPPVLGVVRVVVGEAVALRVGDPLEARFERSRVPRASPGGDQASVTRIPL